MGRREYMVRQYLDVDVNLFGYVASVLFDFPSFTAVSRSKLLGKKLANASRGGTLYKY